MAGLGVVPGVCPPRACGVIEYAIGSSGQTLILTDPVMEHLMLHRQIGADSREAGGQLFARFDGNAIRIERATGPRPSDRRSLMAFVPNRLAERRELRRLFKEGLHYVGDWHTHPEPRPSPSQTDIDSFREMFLKSRHKLASFVMVIVGTEAGENGFYLAICNADGVAPLSPAQGMWQERPGYPHLKT